MLKLGKLIVLGTCLILQYLQFAKGYPDQKNGCFNWQFECHNGDCINAKLKCNTVKDCADGSDETFQECFQQKCEGDRCSYGACFDDSTIHCDGKNDCWDGTDEYLLYCANGTELQKINNNLVGTCVNKPYTQFQCQNSKECIAFSRVCDGFVNCKDGSDESDELCIGALCSEGSFRCAYGGCIAITAACNHKIDCRDESDEVDSICKNWHNITSKEWPIKRGYVGQIATCATTQKIIPEERPSEPEIKHRRCFISEEDKAIRIYTMFNALPYIEDRNVSHLTTVRLGCKPGYALKGENVNVCDNGEWMAPWAECIKVCNRGTIINDRSFSAVCSYKGQVIDCSKDSLLVGTIATMTCAQGYKANGAVKEGERICNENGVWSRRKNRLRLRCTPDCGRTFATVEGYPWIVSIFQYQGNKDFRFSCLGAIISPFYVLTVRNCFSQSNPPESDKILVVQGRKSVEFSLAEEHGYDFSFISNIVLQPHIPLALLKMTRSFILSARIRPICLTSQQEDYDNYFPEGSNQTLGEPLVKLHVENQTYFLTHISDGNNLINLKHFQCNIRLILKQSQMKNN